jgi:probable HAF family extracellular repeat protein
MLRQSGFVLCGIALVFTLAGLASAATYTLTDLGILAGTTGYNSYAMGVNDYGVVAGASDTSQGNSSKAVATIYTGGAWVNIGSGFKTIGGTFATGINDNGQVAGYANSNPHDSFLYNTNTAAYTDIAAQPGVCNDTLNQEGADTYYGIGYFLHGGPINSSGEITGWYSNSAGGINLFVYGGGSTSVVTTPATNVDTDITGASGINNNGVVVGNYAVGVNPIPTGFYYDGTEHDISNMTYPEAIVGNEVVGANYVFTNGHTYTEAVIYTLGASGATNIGALPGDTNGIAYGLDTQGDVVGTDEDANAAFVYSNGVMTNLNTLIPGGLGPFSELNVAMAISPNGEYIVGDGTIAATGYTHGFLLTATPEPSTLLLAASGLLGLLAYVWRKRN